MYLFKMTLLICLYNGWVGIIIFWVCYLQILFWLQHSLELYLLLGLFVYYLSGGILGDKLKQIVRSLWGDVEWLKNDLNFDYQN